ncbi:hypothetical protein D3C72_1269850 [compost metagenome]
MGRGDVDQPGTLGNLFHAQALGIHRYVLQLRTLGQKQLACGGVAGVFHGDLAARLDQNPRDQVQRLLGTVAHQHIGAVATHPAGEGDMPGDGLAQLRQALMSGIAGAAATDLTQGVLVAAAPVIKGKLGFARRSANEVITQGVGGKVRQQVGPRAPFGQGGGAGQGQGGAGCG